MIHRITDSMDWLARWWVETSFPKDLRPDELVLTREEVRQEVLRGVARVVDKRVDKARRGKRRAADPKEAPARPRTHLSDTTFERAWAAMVELGFLRNVDTEGAPLPHLKGKRGRPAQTWRFDLNAFMENYGQLGVQRRVSSTVKRYLREPAYAWAATVPSDWWAFFRSDWTPQAPVPFNAAVAGTLEQVRSRASQLSRAAERLASLGKDRHKTEEARSLLLAVYQDAMANALETSRLLFGPDWIVVFGPALSTKSQLDMQPEVGMVFEPNQRIWFSRGGEYPPLVSSGSRAGRRAPRILQRSGGGAGYPFRPRPES